MSKGVVSPHLLAPLALVGGGAALVAWSWGKWTDVHIDFGSELYLAWRLVEGDVLYGDLAHRNGPLSPYLNALWFQLFGVSLRTLVWANLAILAAIVWMSWRLFAGCLGRTPATAACAVLLGVFAFGQYTPIANYNYVTPYQHAQTHGLALSIALIGALARAGRLGKPAAWALAGLCLGGVLLTKAELAVPAGLTALTGLAIAGPRGRRPAALAAFAGAALAAPLGFAVCLGTALPPRLALAGVLGNFAYLGPALLDDPFYAGVAGLDDPASHALRMLGAFAWIAGFAALASALDRSQGRRLGSRGAALAGLGLFAALVALTPGGDWLGLARALPLTTAVGVAWVGVAWHRAGAAERQRLAPLLLWALWSLALLGKLGLRARFGHYGFALAMPATLLLVALLVGVLPARLHARHAGGRLATALALAALAAGVVGCLRVSQAVYARKSFPVGAGADALLAEDPRLSPRPARLRRALARIQALEPVPQSLVVMPEGASLNYWLRLRNPSRFHLFLPTEMDAFGEDAMLASLRAQPPDVIALVHRGHREFGVAPFGVDPRYGRGLLDWVRDAYERVERIGPEPFGADGFGVVLLRRRGGGP